MRKALDEAAKGRGRVEPNPMVGAVVVQEDRLIAVGHHQRFGGPHAEVLALEAAGDQARGATLYVTLEPCCHFGKTPPCTEAILRAGVARVVAAHRDPFPKVAGGGLARLREAGVEVAAGVGAAAAVDLNAPYLKRVLTGSPYVIAKWAMTLDGKTAAAGGDSRWISSPESRAEVHAVRGRVDGIVVGVGTVLADDPQLTARPPGLRSPTRIVMDSRGRTPLDSHLARTAREVATLIVVGAEAPSEAIDALRASGCEVLSLPEARRPHVDRLLSELGRRGMTNVLLEGGGVVLAAFFEIGAVDEVDVFIAPLIEGGDHARTAVRGVGRRLMSDSLRLQNVRRSLVADDVRIQGEVSHQWREHLDDRLTSCPGQVANPT
ncbi:bifunctional diaminohydroxyphosphoribosylaminopyrimidine deaminase/5-amino-6-(5-phosphoribosylamino)uracil reductase RibD [Paludisphaera sp. Pla2]|uniref:Riboflavin biosynthesis protein RibD n=2 Tax=Paludisphaera mucosa TaxID=3030827 RepID=A0ABT6F5R0_9BACT|nr:bifunctional diaminohydroxyphosphoribosylaminopyrimidine deaminase/5-amino-6-(5-phosphoribosylamino)uracil reductase RibD [Paludisphaera mucosa]MDG3002910.1 bifunctional diaminohydroxyphosphoribosylaminopyrimidine deaminase/5-amino-6-(5-phosphoribosylamino)uracil reductase RibD [Paludisphaera mucosa]